jgi:hypothetical protein
MSPEAMHMRQALPKSYIASFKLSPIRGDEWKSPSAAPACDKKYSSWP